VTPRDERELERRHLLSLLAHYGPMHAASLADRANDECLHDAFDGLPEISRRGIGQKLTAMWSDGLVARAWQESYRAYLWSVTDAGRELAALDPYEPASLDAAPSLPVGGGDGRHRLRIWLEAGLVMSELICPESGCEPVDAEGPPAPCWLRTWAENEDIAANYVQETAQLGVFAVEASFTGDQPNVRIVAPVSSSAGDGPERNGRNEKGAIGTAGDEAREALAHTIHRAIVLASAMTIQKAARGVYAAEMELAQHIAASLSSPLPGAGDGLAVQGLLNAVNNVLVWIANNDLPMDGDDQQEVWAMLDRWEALTGLEHDERGVLLDGRYEEATG